MASIWADIDFESFRKDVTLLRQITSGKDLSLPELHPQPLYTEDSPRSGWLPFRTEKQLAQDFAFLASYEDTPACVSAATISRHSRNRMNYLSLAANQGIKGAVRSTFQQLVGALRLCAQRSRQTAGCPFALLMILGLSQKDCFERCLQIVLGLHTNRILGRLGSAKYVRPKDSTNFSRIRIDAALRDLVSELRSAKTAQAPDNETIANEIQELLQAIRSIDDSRKFPTRDTLRTVLRRAYMLHIGTDSAKFSLSDRLKQLGVPTSSYKGRLARQVQALANYWRICLYLSTAARSYHPLFTAMHLHIVAPGPKKRTVHAEIQLVLYHEVSEELSRPSIIPASKKPCLLCYSFLRAHGLYHASQTHGEVFQKWHVPDREDFSHETRRRLNTALQATALSIKSVLAVSLTQPLSRTDPQMRAQSVITSELDMLRTPSVSTIRHDSVQGMRQCRIERNPRMPQISVPSLGKDPIQPSSTISCSSLSRKGVEEADVEEADVEEADVEEADVEEADVEVNDLDSPDPSLDASSNALNQGVDGTEGDQPALTRDRKDHAECSSASASSSEYCIVSPDSSGTLNFGRLELHVEFSTTSVVPESVGEFTSATCSAYNCTNFNGSDILVHAERLDYVKELCIVRSETTKDFRIALRAVGQPDVVLDCAWNRGQ